MTLDPLLLSRLQWVWVISWHILLPALTVGLASYIAVLEGLAFLTGRDVWSRISAFWTRIFAVSFGLVSCRKRRGHETQFDEGFIPIESRKSQIWSALKNQ